MVLLTVVETVAESAVGRGSGTVMTAVALVALPAEFETCTQYESVTVAANVYDD